MIERSYTTWLPFAAALVLAALLLRFPPDQYSFYPRCPIYAWTHLQCPGCGATRALAALLRGHLMEALRWNALMVILLPVAAGYIGLNYRREGECQGQGLTQPPCWLVGSAFAVVTVFTVARNL